MTIASIDASIIAARAEFKRLNDGRERPNASVHGAILVRKTYRAFSDDIERMIGYRADEIARLRRFRSLLLVKENLLTANPPVC
jgi:hypothetical protein